jgi:RHS repeat-associated protein
MQFPVAESYEYDPSNKRIWKTTSGGEVFTLWGGRGERIGRYAPEVQQRTVDGVVTHKFVWVKQGWEDVYFGGKRLQATDRLGSVGGGGRYYPYGEERSATAEGTDKFATYHRDATGFDYADQRYYSAKFGRFLTSDPYVASGGPAAPKSWNRYAYVEGDPVNHNDPMGLFRCTVVGRVEGASGGVAEVHCTSLAGTVFQRIEVPYPVGSRSEIRNSARQLGRAVDRLELQNFAVLLRNSIGRVQDALRNKKDCRDLFEDPDRVINKATEARLDDLGAFIGTADASGTIEWQRSSGPLGRYNPLTGSIRLNARVNWSAPNQTFATINGAIQLVDVSLGDAANLNQGSPMTANQFMDLVLIHELAHYGGKRNPDDRQFEQLLWEKCVK